VVAVVGLILTVVLLGHSYSSLPSLLSGQQEPSILRLRKLNQPFNWHEEEVGEVGRNISEEEVATCRNSVQGKVVIADDRGQVCPRVHLLDTGCCDSNSSLTSKYSCSSCDSSSSCCGRYEECISCCLRPEQRPGLQQILNRAAESNNVLLVSVADHFELCLAKCRTSSSSVQHENTYRNKVNKYCYGHLPPPTLASSELP